MALISGGDLSKWHNLPLWSERSENAKTGFSPVKYATQADKIAYQRASELFDAASAAERMAKTAVRTTNVANGQMVERVIKRKDLIFPSTVALQDYIVEMIGAQEFRCELTGLPLELDETNGDPAMFASLDRIDSSGNYEKGNLQVVCRFVNFWKGASDDAEFRRLLGVLKSSENV